ncbi:MAG: hypothetical protein HC902_01415 [Calothrix sp. SM1_5_4]|nr:hypothetical protein [Calothrix sp. SM1_5_4]
MNYSLPRELDNYVHRIGRTARSGKTGIAMSFVTPSHRHLIGKIERATKSKMNEGVIPTRKAIGLKKISQMLGVFTDQPGYARALDLMDESWRQAVAGMSSEEVAARFLAMNFPWVFSEKERPQMVKTQATTDNTTTAARITAVTRTTALKAATATATATATAIATATASPSTSAQRKADLKTEKRRTKRDLRKRFTKGYQQAQKGKTWNRREKSKNLGGGSPPKRQARP